MNTNYIRWDQEPNAIHNSQATRWRKYRPKVVSEDWSRNRERKYERKNAPNKATMVVKNKEDDDEGILEGLIVKLTNH